MSSSIDMILGGGISDPSPNLIQKPCLPDLSRTQLSVWLTVAPAPSPAAVPDDDLVVESLIWISAGHMILSASQVTSQDDDREGFDAFLMHLTWDPGSDPTGRSMPQAEDTVLLTAFTPNAVDVSSNARLPAPLMTCFSTYLVACK